MLSGMTTIKRFLIHTINQCRIGVSAAWKAFDIKPVFFLSGITATGYGLYLNFSLGTALIFVGIVFMTVGYLMEAKK